MSHTRKRLLELQRRIHESLQREADRLLGRTPPAIARYEKECLKDFSAIRGRLKEVEKPELVREIRDADVTFIADFHTFAQAQRTALRLIRDAAPAGPSRLTRDRWFIGLEFIASHQQEALDLFQSGKLSLNEFLKAIRYHEEWGFPWSNYSPIFDWAREHGVRLIALNRPKEIAWGDPSGIRRARDITDLIQRDQWAAGVISDLFAAESAVARSVKMIVLYGELHVSTNHLPAHLRRISSKHLGKPLKTLAIHQNQDSLYWQLAQRGREHHVQAVRLRKDAFCVISSTPWTKLQSLVSWAEGETIEDLAEEGSETSADYLSLMRTYSQALAEFLGVHPPSFDSLTVHTIDDADLLSPYFSALIRYHVMNNMRLYIPEEEIAYLGVPSHNGASEIAASHLFRARTGVKRLEMETPDDFAMTTLEAAFAFLGSLILNPRRKCDLLGDHEERLRALKRGKEPAFILERESRELAIGLIRDTADIRPLLRRRSMTPALLVGARYHGQVLGKQVHQGLLAGQIDVETVRSIFLARARVGSFGPRLEKLLAIAPAGSSARSKTETL